MSGTDGARSSNACARKAHLLQRVVALFLIICGCSRAAVEAPVKKNFIFVLVDDWGSYDVAWREQELGRVPQLRTPTLDELSQQGVKLDNYYVQHICTPTRQSLLSGRYQIHTGLQHGIIQNSQKSCLPPAFSTLADAFKAGGWHTSMIGKWHLGLYKDECLPWNRGFDTFYGYLTGSELHYTKMQRSARGALHNASHKILYPDFRTESGPIDTKCIQIPPHAGVISSEQQFCAGPSPSSSPPGSDILGHATECDVDEVSAPITFSNGKANWTFYQGSLTAGNDVCPPKNTTTVLAKEFCDSNTECVGFTFTTTDGTTPSASSCISKKCKIYFKSKINLNSDDAWGTFLKQPLPVPPNPYRTDPTCYSAYMFTTEAQRVIREHANNAKTLNSLNPKQKDSPPLFMYLAMQDVHEPVQAPAHYVSLQNKSVKDNTRRIYAGMVSAVDEAMKNLTHTLKVSGMWENTVLVLSNDNGGWNGYGGLNYPYRGHKTTLWEGGLRGLGVIVAPGIIPQGSRYANMMHVTDWLPTLTAAAGIDLTTLGSGFSHLDGVSHWDNIIHSGDDTIDLAPPRNEILFNIEGINGTGEAALRVGDWKLLRSAHPLPHATMGMDLWCDICTDEGGCQDPHVWPRSAGTGGTFCYNSTRNATAARQDPHYPPVPCTDDHGNQHGCWLFNIASDPSESNNLALSEPAKMSEMLETLSHYNRGNVGCCSCQLVFNQEEMSLPPKDGVWFTFHDQSDPTKEEAPLCDLLRKPPPVRPWESERVSV